jgi:16S rRNA C1402 (ribose-2'-O) methylase RsmI
MPGLSDPGARLIRKCIERDLPFRLGGCTSQS